jgi:hypothetical protein
MKFSYRLFFLLMLTCSATLAQTSKGGFLLGGGISINHLDTDYEKIKPSPLVHTTNKNTAYYVNPSAGYFLFKNIAVGINLGYSRNNRSTKDVLDTSMVTPQEQLFYATTITNGYSISPFIRYYKRLNDKLYFFAHGRTPFAYSYSNDKAKEERYNGSILERTSETHVLSSMIRIEPGLVFFATNKIGIEATFGAIEYSFTKVKSELNQDQLISGDRSLNESFIFALNPRNFALGLQFYLNR